MISIIEKPIDIGEVLDSVRDPAAGGIDLFIGSTRDRSGGKKVISLVYEAYIPMAVAWMERIAGEASARWDIVKISIVHRVGTVGIGEASVVIAVSAIHRSDAFEVCRFLIDNLKREVPIWKKEYFEDGEVWVGLEGNRPAGSDSVK